MERQADSTGDPRFLPPSAPDLHGVARRDGQLAASSAAKRRAPRPSRGLFVAPAGLHAPAARRWGRRSFGRGCHGRMATLRCPATPRVPARRSDLGAKHAGNWPRTSRPSGRAPPLHRSLPTGARTTWPGQRPGTARWAPDGPPAPELVAKCHSNWPRARRPEGRGCRRTHPWPAARQPLGRNTTANWPPKPRPSGHRPAGPWQAPIRSRRRARAGWLRLPASIGRFDRPAGGAPGLRPAGGRSGRGETNGAAPAVAREVADPLGAGRDGAGGALRNE